MSLLSALAAFAREFRETHARHVTERQILSLPIDVQKDIGWPAGRPARRSKTGFFVNGN